MISKLRRCVRVLMGKQDEGLSNYKKPRRSGVRQRWAWPETVCIKAVIDNQRIVSLDVLDEYNKRTPIYRSHIAMIRFLNEVIFVVVRIKAASGMEK